jgi:tetratricopeptide (TPR) repeat protein
VNASSPLSPEAQRDIASALAQADAMRRSGRNDAAEDICRQVLRVYPMAVPAMNYLALLLKERDALSEAASLLSQAIRIAPMEPVLHNSLGSVQFRQGDAAAAEACYRQAVQLRPDYVEAHYNHGLMLRELGRTDDALAAQRRALALKPDYADALAQAGALLTDKGEYAEAMTMLDAAVAIHPGHFSAQYYRGVALEAQAQHENAIETLNKAIALRPQSGEAHYVLGNALNNAGREDEALDAYRRAIETAPELVDAHVDFNALAWMLGRTDQVFKSFAYARGKVGDKPNLLLAESEQRLRFNDAPAAEQLLRRALDLAPERGELTNALGRALVVQGRLTESIPMFENAIRLQPEGISHYQELAISQLHLKQPTNALATIERGLAVAPYEQLSLGLLTLAYRELGDARLRPLTDIDSVVRKYRLPAPPGFPDAESFNRELAEELGRLHTRTAEPFDQTLRGGTQTWGNLFDRPPRAVSLLRDRISEAVEDYIRNMPDDPSHPLFARKQDVFSFRGAWSCRLRSAGYHTNHVHPQGWISSVYYVDLPDAVADESAKQGWLTFGKSNLELGALDRYSHTVQPIAGTLVLFPSYFWHGTVPFRSDDVRLTVAFDVVPGTLVTVPRAGSAY